MSIIFATRTGVQTISPEAEDQKRIIRRLTALWALSESGLGGIMFALKIPLTGFLVGGFAVIIISLIAHFSGSSYKTIIRSLIIVLIVKALVSPHSPPPAYAAVAFQGFIGALLFRSVHSFRLACILLGILSMAESALQKLIILTLIFGSSLWKAVDAMFMQISKEFRLHPDAQFSLWVIGCYLLLYAVWGAVVGNWAAATPQRINSLKKDILQRFDRSAQNMSNESPETKRSKNIKRVFLFLLILIFILSIFLLTGVKSKTLLFILFRSIAAVLLLFFVLQPVIKYFIRRRLAGLSPHKRKEAEDIVDLLPQMRSFVQPSYKIAREERNPFKKLRTFILAMLILGLYGH